MKPTAPDRYHHILRDTQMSRYLNYAIIDKTFFLLITVFVSNLSLVVACNIVY